MSGSYGFSANLEMSPAEDIKDLHEKVKEFLSDKGNEGSILDSLLFTEEEDKVVFFGDNEDTWRYDYSKEVIGLLREIEKLYGGYFKGELLWFTYELHSDVTQEYLFDGEGGAKYNITTEELEEDYYPDEEE